ncbi:SDR family NAD(P)-dependent oxidoreductase, partial [Mycobacteroides abscessus subsp. massiliense]
GLETAKALAAHGAHVVLAVRNAEKGKAAAEAITAAHSNADVTLQSLDLSSLESVRRASDELKGRYDKIDLLINNAGVMWTEKSSTADGFELQF